MELVLPSSTSSSECKLAPSVHVRTKRERFVLAVEAQVLGLSKYYLSRSIVYLRQGAESVPCPGRADRLRRGN